MLERGCCECAGVDVTVVAVPDVGCLGGGVFECIPATIRTTTRMTTAAIATRTPSRFGRWLMEFIALSSTPVMKVDFVGSFGSGVTCESTKSTGSPGLLTGGGGAGGTIVWPGSVSRTVEEPETRNALAGYGASSPPLSAMPSDPDGECVRISSRVCSWR